MDLKPRVLVCVPVCERSLTKLEQAIIDAERTGDLIELRLDCLDSPPNDDPFGNVEPVFSPGRRFILTYRPAEQGGQRELNYESRLHFWLGKLPAAELFDIELDLCSNASALKFDSSEEWSRIICSHHDFSGVPADLEKIYERMAATPARILKIAVQANDITDCLPVFKILERARAQGREMIAIAMGSAGVATRILGPSRGAFLTYGALSVDDTTAPGQIPAQKLREVYRIDKLDPETEITGLIGWPVSHSVSPNIHNAAFAAASVNAVYIPFEVRHLGTFFQRMIDPRTREMKWNVRGLSVTAPHKTAVMNYLDWIEPAAQAIGAVNTIAITSDGLQGYNTDAAALANSLKETIGELRGVRSAVIGAGGAASSALYALRREAANVTIFARNPDKARTLAERFDSAWNSLEAANFGDFDLVINTTPLGTLGPLEEETPARSNQLRGARLAYDLVYNPSETRFLREARIAGCQTLSGISMLIEQAGSQFKLWTDIDPPLSTMRAAAVSALGSNTTQ